MKGFKGVQLSLQVCWHLVVLYLKLHANQSPLTFVMASERFCLAQLPAWQPGPAVVGCVVQLRAVVVTGATTRLGLGSLKPDKHTGGLWSSCRLH